MISVLLGIAVMIVRMVGVVKGVCLRCHKHYLRFTPSHRECSQTLTYNYSRLTGRLTRGTNIRVGT